MKMNMYVKDWLNGFGRPDLARKAERDELPELKTEEAEQLFAKFRKGEADPKDFMAEIFGMTS